MDLLETCCYVWTKVWMLAEFWNKFLILFLSIDDLGVPIVCIVDVVWGGPGFIFRWKSSRFHRKIKPTVSELFRSACSKNFVVLISMYREFSRLRPGNWWGCLAYYLFIIIIANKNVYLCHHVWVQSVPTNSEIYIILNISAYLAETNLIFIHVRCTLFWNWT